MEAARSHADGFRLFLRHVARSETARFPLVTITLAHAKPYMTSAPDHS
ncbi:MAG: hypothetical protein ACI835_001300 [Planctomycetota bacterium]|jgi:hypothetical protein